MAEKIDFFSDLLAEACLPLLNCRNCYMLIHSHDIDSHFPRLVLPSLSLAGYLRPFRKALHLSRSLADAVAVHLFFSQNEYV